MGEKQGRKKEQIIKAIINEHEKENIIEKINKLKKKRLFFLKTFKSSKLWQI